MSEVLYGANPCVRLFDGDTVTAFASIWVVERSEHGAGQAIVLWHDGRVRVLCANPAFGEWLERAFVRYFPEVAELTWSPPTTEASDVRVDLDPERGLVARGGDVMVTMSGGLARRRVEIDGFDLDGVSHGLCLTIVPMSAAAIEVNGRRLPGSVRREGTADRPSSSAFLTIDEAWTRPAPSS